MLINDLGNYAKVLSFLDGMIAITINKISAKNSKANENEEKALILISNIFSINRTFSIDKKYAHQIGKTQNTLCCISFNLKIKIGVITAK